MSNQVTIREIAERGITITADETGLVYVNGHAASQPITAQGQTFVWAPKAVGAPASTRIGLPADALAKLNAHAAAFRAASAAAHADYQNRARRWNNAHNEGGEGYTPYNK